MQKNYRLILSIVALVVSSLCAFAQEQVEYKDVFLDGKPAKLNVATGEVTLVKVNVKSIKTETNSGNNNSKLVTNNHVTTASNETDAGHINDSDFYVVKENETLLEVSKKYSVSLTQLKQANNLKSTLINKGQRLRVNNFDAVSGTTSQSIDTYTEYVDSSSPDFHIVSKNETLFSLAKQYGLTVNELKRLNNLSSNLIIPNQKLRVNGFAELGDVNNSSVHIVKRGDNLYRIALNNGTTVEAIKRLNGLTSNVIKIGQKLQLN